MNPIVYLNRAAISAFTYSSTSSGDCSGRVYVYGLNRATSTWSHTSQVLDMYDKPSQASVPTPNHFFGIGISMYGKWMAIGAPGRQIDGGTVTIRGSVYFYEYDGTQWQFRQSVQGSLGHVGDTFGQSISLHERWCSVTAPETTNPGTTTTTKGVTYLFELNEDPGGDGWGEIHRVLHGNPSSTLSMDSNQISALFRPWWLVGALSQPHREDPDLQGAGSAQALPIMPILHYTSGPLPGSDFFCYNVTNRAGTQSGEGLIHVHTYAQEAVGIGAGAIIPVIQGAVASTDQKNLSLISLILAAFGVLVILIGLVLIIVYLFQSRSNFAAKLN